MARRLHTWLMLSLIATLSSLVHVLFVSRSPSWVSDPEQSLVELSGLGGTRPANTTDCIALGGNDAPQWKVFGQSEVVMSPIDAKIAQIRQRLLGEASQLRYYVYNFQLLGIMAAARWALKGMKPRRKLMARRYGDLGNAEAHMIETFFQKRNHSLRTSHPWEADYFIVPFSMTAALTHCKNISGCYDNAFQSLYSEPVFQAMKGHRHIILTQLDPSFSYDHLHTMKLLGLAKHYRKLWNVTVAKETDTSLCRYAANFSLSQQDFRGAMTLRGVPVSRSSFSLGLMPSINLPFIPASYERFQNATYFLFHRSRPTTFLNNSTKYRRFMRNQSLIDSLPRSSIGTDLPYAKWLEHFSSSQFCLNIRGDTPSSKSHLRAVKMGCIPVVVSDMYQYWAPTLKSSLQMQDYSIFIDEATFLNDPAAALMQLKDLGPQAIQEKIRALSLAQQIYLPDHPESLFIPAFLWEAGEARRHALPQNHYRVPDKELWVDIPKSS